MVMHRDLKLNNMLLDKKLDVKICDFGLATTLKFEGEIKRSFCGTPNFMAPEILDGGMGYSFEADVWSIGITLYMMLVGVPPFEGKSIDETYKNILTCKFDIPSRISSSAKELI
jgi:polo-like kinase 1